VPISGRDDSSLNSSSIYKVMPSAPPSVLDNQTTLADDPDARGVSVEDRHARNSQLESSAGDASAPAVSRHPRRARVGGAILIHWRYEGAVNPYFNPETGATIFPKNLLFWSIDKGSMTLREFFDLFRITVVHDHPTIPDLTWVRLPEGVCLDPNGFFVGDWHLGTLMRSIDAPLFKDIEMHVSTSLYLGIEEKWRRNAQWAMETLPEWLAADPAKVKEQ
jgi:hypothetical protein